MKRTHSFLLTASIVLATTFTLSCSGDDGGGQSSSSNGGGGSNCTADFGSITIGSQVWAKKNLNCNVGDSKCYGNDPENCTKYGRLYDWNTAMTACPSGWHLPTDAEWDILVDFAGGSETAGAKLKATSGWNNNGNGTDNYGFSALPGGNGLSGLGGSFGNVGNDGYWWSATEESANIAHYQQMSYDDDYASTGYGGVKSLLSSVRCVKD